MRVTLPLEAPVAEVVERISGHQIDGLGRLAGALERRRKPDVPDLDHAVLWSHAHEAGHAFRCTGVSVHDGDEERILR